MGDVSVPFAAYRSAVRAEWLDYNGHMNDSSYGIVLSEANELLFVELGLSADYRASTGASLYTVESHIRYLAECSLEHTLNATTMVVAAGDKKVHLYTELFRDDDRLAATGEFLYVHVDTALGSSVPMPSEQRARVQEMASSHSGLPPPGHLGLGVGSSRQRSGSV